MWQDMVQLLVDKEYVEVDMCHVYIHIDQLLLSLAGNNSQLVDMLQDNLVVE